MAGIIREKIKTLSSISPLGKRSKQWPKVRKEKIKKNPKCACCHKKHFLQVHHIQPFQFKPELELDPDNLIVLCGRCHLLIGHLGWWKAMNPFVVFDAHYMGLKIKGRSQKFSDMDDHILGILIEKARIYFVFNFLDKFENKKLG